MLTVLRKQTGSLLIKGLLVLLIISFGAWGIEDWLNPAMSGSSVAEVGNVEIKPNQLRQSVNRQMAQIRNVFGNQITTEQALKFGVIDTALNELISRALVLETAKDVGVSVSDTLLGEKIRNAKAYQGFTGKFDRLKFEQALRSMGMTEEMYVNALRDDVAISHLAESIGNRNGAPSILVNTIFDYQNESRAVDLIDISSQSMTLTEEPLDSELESFLKEKSEMFESPEFRTITYISLGPEDFIDENGVDETAMIAQYQAEIENFSVEETRRINQIIYDDEAKAEMAYDDLKAGMPFAEIKQKYFKEIDSSTSDLGFVSKADLLPSIASQVFGLKKGSVSRPIKSSLGWHLIEVTDVKAGQVKSFEEVKENIRLDIARENARDYLYEISKDIDDTLGGGATLEETAHKFSIKTKKIEFLDNEGKDKNGVSIESLPADKNFIKAVFDLEEGGESPILESSQDNIVIVRVDSIIPRALKSIDSIRKDLILAWKHNKRVSKAGNLTKKLVDKINRGESISKNIEALALPKKRSVLLKRDNNPAKYNLTDNFVAQVFSIKIGSATFANIDDSFKIAHLKKIEKLGQELIGSDVGALKTKLSSGIDSDIMAQFGEALKIEYEVKINKNVIESMYSDTNVR